MVAEERAFNGEDYLDMWAADNGYEVYEQERLEQERLEQERLEQKVQPSETTSRQ